MPPTLSTPTFLVAGSPGHIGAADIARKLRAACASLPGRGCEVLLDADSRFADAASACGADRQRAKMALYESIRRTGRATPSAVLLPTVESQRFAPELAEVSGVPVPGMLQALDAHLAQHAPHGARIGVLASGAVQRLGLFDAARLRMAHGGALDALDECIGKLDATAWAQLDAASFDLRAVEQACAQLQAEGADIIVTGSTLLGPLSERLAAWGALHGVTLIDINTVHARHVAALHGAAPPRPFKIGVLGGVGPAATVGFLDMLVRATPARRDQDHLKIVVEQNPQIPDRTEHLIGDGADPTLELFATCKRLEAADASLIAIPCNTAHAFVRHLQPMLGIPIVHMLRETAGFIAANYPDAACIGLLATSGTIASRVYHDEIEATGRSVLTPDAAGQQQVMDIIYGEHGVKAGQLTPANREALHAAIAGLCRRGARVVILGCTELPLLVPQALDGEIDGWPVHIIDPALVLAQRCVALGLAGVGQGC